MSSWREISCENNDLFLNYIDNATSFREEVLEVNKEKLVIKSNSGLVYNYKPYEALDLSQ